MADEEEEVFYDAEDSGHAPEPPTQRRAAGGSGPSYEAASVYELHRAAFYNDTARLALVLQQMPPEQHTELDLHGNTALHVAAMRDNTAAIEALLDAGLPAAVRSSRGWKAFDEACAAGAMKAARLLQQRMHAEAKAHMKARRSQLLASLRELPDYTMQLKWQLGSAVPGLGLLLRRYAPHDTYTIWKVGRKLRIDGSLMGINTSSMVPEWKRGHFSLIVDGSPEGVAAAAAAADEAAAEARAAAQLKRQVQRQAQQQQQQQQQRQQQQQSGGSDSTLPVAAPPTPMAAGAAGSLPAPPPPPQHQQHSQQQQQQQQQQQSSHDSVHCQQQPHLLPQPQQQPEPAQQQQQHHDEEFFEPEAPAGGPRLLFLNHDKQRWVDLSADKKALAADAEASEGADALDSELLGAMESDVDKLRLKPREFRFAPLKGWLGGDMTETVAGWKCTVYEATGKLLAVNTSKAHLMLQPGASFEDYLAAEYAADEVRETLLDPLSLQGMDTLSSSAAAAGGKGGRSRRNGGGAGGGGHEDDWFGGGDGSAFMAGDGEYDGLVWSEQAAAEQPLGSSTQGSSAGSSSSSSAADARKKRVAAAKGGGGGGGDGSSAKAAGGRLLRARCWMARDFPMSLSQLLPLLDVMGAANKHMAKVGKFLAKYSQLEQFPVKLQVPLLLTVYALVSFKAFALLVPGSGHPPPGDAFFEVPAPYQRRRLQEVMDKAAAKASAELSAGGAGPRGPGDLEAFDELDAELRAAARGAAWDDDDGDDGEGRHGGRLGRGRVFFGGDDGAGEYAAADGPPRRR